MAQDVYVGTGTELTLRRIGAIRRLVERDALAIAVIALWTAALASWLPSLFISDSWLALVDGRLIAQHGLPHADTLTVWTVGRRWIDQQWGAQVIFYGLAKHGGLRAAGALGLACVAAALAGAAIATRKLGASPRSAALGVLLPVLAAPWLAEVRSQSLALAPFVAVYALLALDARRPGRRVLLVLPVLVVWANLHGSVALAAGLVSLYGLTLLLRPGARRRAVALVVGAPLTLLVSPYGLDLVHYYRTMLVSPPLARVVTEWQPMSVRGSTIVFFVSAFALVALWGRHRRALTSFEQWAIVLLLVAALAAIRNAVWFELALAVSLPRLLDAAWPSAPPTAAVRRANLFLGGLAAAGLAAVLVVQLGRGDGRLERNPPPSAAAAIAAAAGEHGVVLADDKHADWLLWQEPSLAGRVAFDVRFELSDARELHDIVLLQQGSRPVWRRCGSTARVVTVADAHERRLLVDQGVLDPGARLVVASRGFGAFVQTPSAPFCRL